MIRPLLASVLSHGRFLMQTKEDAERIIQLGAPESQVSVSGDIKLDGLRTELTTDEILSLEKSLPIQGRIWIAGSTHRGEESILLDVYSSLLGKWPDLYLILAPRHLSRISEIRDLLEKREIPYTLRSQIKADKVSKVIVLDTYGELFQIYFLANVVFVGGTLVPIGGHNLMEPAALGKPVLFGPYITNCKRQAELLMSRQAGRMVRSPEELEKTVEILLAQQDEAQAMGDRGRKTVLENRGAMAICISEIEKTLGYLFERQEQR